MFASGRLLTLRAPLRIMRMHLRRVFVVPAVAGVEPAAAGRAHVRVDGMVCTACAARTGAAFRRMPGVRSVHVDLDAGMATVECDPGTTLDARTLQRALDAVVVARPARRLLARVATAVVRRRSGSVL